MIELLGFISYVVNLYEYVVIAAVVLSWLVAFNVVNYSSPFVRSLMQAIGAVTEPFLRRIRRVLPDMGGLDLSPVVLLLACLFIRAVIIPNIAKAFV